MSLGPRYVPDYRLTLGGEPAPAELRASITSITHISALEGADRRATAPLMRVTTSS